MKKFVLTFIALQSIHMSDVLYAAQACRFQAPSHEQVQQDFWNAAAQGTLDANKLAFFKNWGARLDERNAQNKTALDLALDHHHEQVVDLLLKQQGNG